MRIDLTALRQHAAQSAVALHRLELRVTASDLPTPIVSSVPADSLTFDITVASGSARRFEIEGYSNSVGIEAPEATVYWGEVQQDLPARATMPRLR